MVAAFDLGKEHPKLEFENAIAGPAFEKNRFEPLVDDVGRVTLRLVVLGGIQVVFAIQLTDQEYSVLKAVADVAADRGEYVTAKKLAAATSVGQSKGLARILRTLEKKSLVVLDDKGSAKVDEQGVAVLASL